MATPNPNTTKTNYRDLCIEEAVARIADLEHDYVLVREMLQGALAIAAKLTDERERRLLAEAEAERLRAYLMADAILAGGTQPPPRPYHPARRGVRSRDGVSRRYVPRPHA